MTGLWLHFAADIQTTGRSVIEHTKRQPFKSCIVKKWTVNMSVVTLWAWYCQRVGGGTNTSVCFDWHQGLMERRVKLCEAAAHSTSWAYVRDYDILCSCSTLTAYIPLKHTRSTSKTHLNGMTGPWARHLQQVLSAGNSRLWVMFTKSQCEGPSYLRCWAESLGSGLVLWLFGIYLVIRPLKGNGGMKALALLNLLLLAYFV